MLWLWGCGFKPLVGCLGLGALESESMRVLRGGALVLVCLALLFPVWLMVSNSFSDSHSMLSAPPRLFPKGLTLGNYREVFALPMWARWTANSVAVVSAIVVLGVLVNGAAGYVFAFGSARWLKPVFWALMAPVFVTRFVLIISQFVVIAKLGLRGLPAVILIPVFWPQGIFLFRNFFGSVPASLLETARLEGASEMRILVDVVLPICAPILGAAIVFLAMAGMGDFVWQMVNLQMKPQQTVLVALVNSTIDYYGWVDRIGYDLAVGTVLFVPYVVLFAFTSRYFVKGLAAGSTKE